MKRKPQGRTVHQEEIETRKLNMIEREQLNERERAIFLKELKQELLPPKAYCRMKGLRYPDIGAISSDTEMVLETDTAHHHTESYNLTH